VLTITQIHYIRKLFFDKGKSLTEIEEATGHNYRTIKKYVDCDDFNEPTKIKNRDAKSDLIRPFVREILEQDKIKKKKHRHTAKSIYKRAKVEAPNLCLISDRRMRDIVKQEKKLLYDEKCFIDLEHTGGEAQVDFGEILIKENGETIKAHELVLSFPHSNAGFCQVTRSEGTQALLEGLTVMFQHIGKVPRKIWFDQMATAAIRMKNEHGEVVMTDTMLRYSTHFGFDAVFCNPNSGHEKGNVENKVGYFRNNIFIPELELINLQELNRKILIECDEDNEKSHYELKSSQKELLETEKVLMSDLPLEPFDSSKAENRRVDKYGHIVYETNHYSVSPSYVGEQVRVVVKANELIFQDKKHHEITRHQRSFKKDQKYTHWADFIDIVSHRPRALKYSGFYSLLPLGWKAYTENLDNETLKEALRFLKYCMIYHNLDMAEVVLSENTKLSVFEPEALWTSLYRIKENKTLYQSELKEHHFPEMPKYKTSLDDYDRLLGGYQ